MGGSELHKCVTDMSGLTFIKSTSYTRSNVTTQEKHEPPGATDAEPRHGHTAYTLSGMKHTPAGRPEDALSGMTYTTAKTTANKEEC